MEETDCTGHTVDFLRERWIERHRTERAYSRCWDMGGAGGRGSEINWPIGTTRLGNSISIKSASLFVSGF